MSKAISYLILLSIILFSVIVSSCGLGTDTGNPTNVDTETEGSDDGTEGSMAITTETGLVISSLCNQVSDCFDDVNTSDCATALDTDLNSLAAFGVNTVLYKTFTAVQTAIDSGTLIVNSVTLNQCTNAIDNVSCASMELNNVFDESDPTDFSNVHLAVPDECDTVF